MASTRLIAAMFGFFVMWPALGAEYGWRTECVGLLVVDLPGDAVVAGISLKELRSEILTPSQDRSFRFYDGQLAPWPRVLYKGELLVSNKLDAAQKSTVSKDFDNAKMLVAGRLKQLGREAAPIRDIAEFPPASKAWGTKSSVRMLVDLGEHLLFARISEPAGEAAATEVARALAKNLSYRGIFDVPGPSGVCLPNAYVKDTNVRIRNVGSMYRLVDHPDVTVYLRDANAAHYDEPVRERNASPKRLNESFWAQYGLHKSVRRIASVSKTTARFSLLTGWHNGFASVGTIERKDGVIDTGYFAALRGDSLDLELIVMQDAANATARGVAPLTRENFLAMAARLAATVRCRGN